MTVPPSSDELRDGGSAGLERDPRPPGDSNRAYGNLHRGDRLVSRRGGVRQGDHDRFSCRRASRLGCGSTGLMADTSPRTPQTELPD